MPQTIVWNQLGAQAGEIISSACTEVEVVNIDRDPRQVPDAQGPGPVRRAPPGPSQGGTAVRRRVVGQRSRVGPRRADRDRPVSPGIVREQDGHLCSGPIGTGHRRVRPGRRPRLREAGTGDLVRGGPAPEATVLGQVQGKTIGIFGFGAIGRGVAVRAQAFGMSVLATRRTGNPSEIEGVTIVGLDDLLAASDHLVLAAPSTDLTVNLLDAARLRQVKRGAHVINVARGTLLDNEALLNALDRGQVSRATLDVAEPEPLPLDHPLRLHPRARVSDHVSGRVAGVGDRLIGLFVDNLRRFVAGKPLLGQVDCELGY